MLISLRLPAEPRMLTAALEGVVAVNRCVLAGYPETPLLYSSGVRYRAEAKGREEWWAIPTVLAHRVGDCEDLCTWRVAELRERFDEPRARCEVLWAVPRKLLHVFVVRGDGSIEDPSALLGMRV